MDEKYTTQELLIVEEGINYYREQSIWMLKRGTIICIIVALVVLLVLGASFKEAMLFFLFMLMIVIYCWYNVFGRPYYQLKKDIKEGRKIIQTAIIKKIANSKQAKIYKLSNGIKLTAEDLLAENLKEENIIIGQELELTYTPHNKMILTLKKKG
jgi:hypothetical protein